MRFRIRSALRSHVGKVRTVNEDSALSRDEVRLWLVADGMGGHAHGDWASQTLVQQLADLDFSQAPDRAATLIAALRAGNAAILEAAGRAGRQMGTTVVLLHMTGEADGDGNSSDLLCLWVGDSRAYRFRAGGLVQLTHDHSVVQDLVDSGKLAAADAETHPLSHMLSRAVGTAPELSVDAVHDQALPGDHYLLCSDGLTKVVPEDVIARLLRLPSVNAIADRLIAETLARGAPDNVTVIILSIEEMTAVLPEPA